MVAAVSESWGVRPDGESGKVVWFTLPASSPVVAATLRSPYEVACEAPLRHTVDVRRPEHAPARSAVVG
jgi:hypothetical protein